MTDSEYVPVTECRGHSSAVRQDDVPRGSALSIILGGPRTERNVAAYVEPRGKLDGMSSSLTSTECGGKRGLQWD
jgi:hypothetical protein